MIYPVVLCGGSGTRLWPLSRKSYPKQFAKLVGDQTLFQATCQRFIQPGFAAPTIVTSENFRFTVLDELADIEVEPREIILEPAPKNTAPAVLAATLRILQEDPSAQILVLPADHNITDLAAFDQAISTVSENLKTQQIATFGIVPTRAETGYGYLELERNISDVNGVEKLVRFVEKPDLDKAEQMLAAGNFLWNAGIFMSSAQNFSDEYQKHQTEMTRILTEAMEKKTLDYVFVRPDEAAWAQCDSISIDYAIMENSAHLVAIPVDMGWSDLGDWKAVWEVSEKTENGVALAGEAFEIDCKNSLLRSEKEGQVIAGIGLENIFAIAMNDAVVVGHMDQAQNVKSAVSLIKSKNLKQAEEFPRDHRPWGWYETLALGERFQVKRIVVKPGAALSLQSHHHRSEHWTVVEGTAKVTVDDEIKLLGENMSVYIPLGAVHRMENPGKIPLTLIEVQSGSYLKEDDIIRYEDVFGRT